MKVNIPSKTSKRINPNRRQDGSGNHSESVPYGREAVKEAILETTEKMLLDHHQNEISVREIAKAAKIKHPLIHRHFGTKDALIRAVHHRSIERTRQAVEKVENIEENIETFFRTVEQNKFRQIAVARAMIEGVNPQLLQPQFPVIQHFWELIKKGEPNRNPNRSSMPEY